MRKNVFQLYEENGNRAGFWIRRDWWHRCYAFVHSIGGITSGPLPGSPPYYGNPKVLVSIVGSKCVRSGNYYLPCPGSYQWEAVDIPALVEGGNEVQAVAVS